MIRIGNYNPHAYYENSHISAPRSTYSRDSKTRELPAEEMMKVERVYVGGKLVYPEAFRYTLKYRSRLDYSFHGISRGTMRDGTYVETITNGYIEDIVRLDTVFPTYIRDAAMECPEDYYVPGSSPSGNPAHSVPPWGRLEQYIGWGGTEHLITPAFALLGPPPGTYDDYWENGGSIYQKYTDKNIYPGSEKPRMSYRIIVQRTVSSSTDHPVMRSYEHDLESYSTHYTFRARKTEYPYTASDEMKWGCYYNTGYRGMELRVSQTSTSFITYGLMYRKPGSVAGEGLYLCTDMENLHSNSVLLGTQDRYQYGYRLPGYAVTTYLEGCTIKAPPFTGHKHIDCYDTRWNMGRNEITSWEDPNVDLWSHTDLDGSFEILENNNPVFGSAAEYVQAYMG